jgi:NTP pyrophosphatase (non-canonical NTP hydrolase)
MSEPGARTLGEAQHAVADLARASALSVDALARALDVAAEVGELAKEALEATRYGSVPFVPSQGWSNEMGDVLFALLALADVTHVDLDQALRATLDKLADRNERSGTLSSRG